MDRKEKSIDLSRSVTQSGVVKVKSIGMDFIVKDTLNSGWNTFKYTNESTEVHFILMDLYPEGKNARNTKNEVLPPFEEGMKLIMNNDMESAVAAFGKLPAWFQEIKYMGGTGLISPNRTAISTIYLEPGLYIMECYVKMADGTWHTSHGMYKEIIVTGPNTDLAPPIETVAIEISSKAGILVADNIPKGKQVFKVTFRDQSTHEHFLGHDVNLVKYDTTASLDSLVHWMNWMNPRGLRTPAPKGFTFLGGMNNLPSGKHGYFDADLSPGNYVLISEVPHANEKNMMYKFTIK
jgi:hypothetical protein